MLQVEERRELTDQDVLKVSRRLHQKSDLRKVALQLGHDSNTIDTAFTKHGTDHLEAAHDLLSQWRSSQEDDFNAYTNLCFALVHHNVNLKRVATRELGFQL